MFFFPSEENRSRGGDDDGRVSSSARRSQLARGSTQAEAEEWSFRGYNRIRGSREAVTGAKSTCSGMIEEKLPERALIMPEFQFLPVMPVIQTTMIQFIVFL